LAGESRAGTRRGLATGSVLARLAGLRAAGWGSGGDGLSPVGRSRSSRGWGTYHRSGAAAVGSRNASCNLDFGFGHGHRTGYATALPRPKWTVGARTSG